MHTPYPAHGKCIADRFYPERMMVSFKDFTCVRLPKLTCEFMAVRNIQSIYQYFESAHGQLTSFIRHIAIKDIGFHYSFVAAMRLMEVSLKDFTCVRLPKLTYEFMAVRNIQSILAIL